MRYQEEYIPFYAIHSGVPQGSILGPILYSLYTTDLPETEQTLTETYIDDTAILASHHDPIAATEHLQYRLCCLEQWLKNVAYTSQRNQIDTCYLQSEKGRLSCCLLNRETSPKTPQ